MGAWVLAHEPHAQVCEWCPWHGDRQPGLEECHLCIHVHICRNKILFDVRSKCFANHEAPRSSRVPGARHLERGAGSSAKGEGLSSAWNATGTTWNCYQINQKHQTLPFISSSFFEIKIPSFHINVYLKMFIWMDGMSWKFCPPDTGNHKLSASASSLTGQFCSTGYSDVFDAKGNANLRRFWSGLQHVDEGEAPKHVNKARSPRAMQHTRTLQERFWKCRTSQRLSLQLSDKQTISRQIIGPLDISPISFVSV